MLADAFAGLDPANRQGPGVTPEQVGAIDRLLGETFPADFARFLGWSDGWEGWIGDQYLRLHGVDELVVSNDVSFREAFPGLVAIGSDGALETYALDFRRDRVLPIFVALDRSSADDRDIWPIADGFSDALDSMRRGDIPAR